MIDALAAEWTKLRTMRAAWIVLAVTAGFVAMAAALAWSAALAWDSLPPGRQRGSIASLPALVHWMAGLAFGALGALVVAREYSSGMVRATFTAMPRRGRVLAAKAVLVAAATGAVITPALLATWYAARAVLGDRAMEGVPGPLADEWAPMAAMAASTVMFALLGLGVAAAARSATVSIALLAALWYVVPMTTRFLPEPWGERAGSVLPGGLADQIAASGSGSVYGDLLTPAGAAAAMAAWALLPLLAARPSLRRGV